MSSINVLYPFDNNYAAYAGISLTSLLINNKNAENINIYILGFGLSDNSKTKFIETAEFYNRNIYFIEEKEVSDYILSLGMPSYRGASIAVARLFISKYLPKDVDRIIYLDSDTLVVGDLSELIEAELENHPVGMVCDSVARDYKRYVGFENEERYYNAGMIVYDMALWRDQNCSERIASHILNVRNNYEALDQDLLNIVLKDEICCIDLRYNLQPFHLVYSSEIYTKIYGNQGYYSKEEIEKAVQNSIILHTFRYLGAFPWHAGNIHPERGVFLEYKEKSQWADILDASDIKKDLVIRIERVLYKLLPQKCFLKLFRCMFEQSFRRKNKQLVAKKKYKNI